MKNFQYLRPKTLDEALGMRREYGASARLLLGGTDLMIRIQKGQAEPDYVIDLKHAKDIGDSAVVEDGYVKVGSRMILSDLVENETVRRLFPALVDAASTVGSVQIRNRATLTGNICNASPAADTVPALLVYGARVEIAGPEGRRRIPLGEFLLGPGKTACSLFELVVSLEIPVPAVPFGAAFGRMTRRRGVDLATINLACGIDNQSVTTFVFGAAGPTAVLVRDESGRLADPQLSGEETDRILGTLVDRTSPISDVRAEKDYRTAMLMSVGRRVLNQARQRYLEQAGGK